MERQKQPSSVTFNCFVISVEMVGRARWGWDRKWVTFSRAASLWVCSVEHSSREMLWKVHDQIGFGSSACHVFFWRFTAHIWILGTLKHPRVKSQKSLISSTLLSWKRLQLNWPGTIIFLGEVVQFSSVQFSRSVVSDSLRPHGQQHAGLSCPSPTPRACSNSCPSSRWCHPTISPPSSPSPPALNLFQHQGLFRWVSS